MSSSRARSPTYAVSSWAIGTIDSKYKEYAAFANVTIKFTPSFDLTLGGRYSNNDQDVVQNADGLLFGVASPPSPPATPRKTYSPIRSRRNSSSTIGWRFTRASPRAFRPGGPNVIAPDAGGAHQLWL